MARLAPAHVALAALLLSPLFVSTGCGDDSNPLISNGGTGGQVNRFPCGPGTHESSGVCVPDAPAGGGSGGTTSVDPGGSGGKSGSGQSGKGDPGSLAGQGGEGGGPPMGVCGEGTVLVDGVCQATQDSNEGGSGGKAGSAGQAGAAGSAGSSGQGGQAGCVPVQGGAAGASSGSGPFGGSGGSEPFGGGGDPFGGGGDPEGGGGSDQGKAGSAPDEPPPCPACDSSTTDCDGDGWTVAQGDCCDQPGPCGQTPELQNPGAVEYKGDGVDNDCDGFFDENEKPCDASLKSSPNDAFDYLKALDLCQFTQENVPVEKRKWGVISAQFTTTDGKAYPNPKQRSIRPKFGDLITPLRGQSLLVLSTGIAADIYSDAKNPPMWELGDKFSNIDNDMDTEASFPADWLEANNGLLPTGCTDDGTDDTQANDSVMLTIRMRVPTNAQSFSLQGLFMSAEFPEYICQSFNDLFLVLVKNEKGEPASPNPKDGNVAFLRTGSGTNVKKFPVGINLAGDPVAQKLFSACDPKNIQCSTSPVDIECALGPETLKGTGYDRVVQDDVFGSCKGDGYDTIGGATDWLTVAGNVVPGGIVELRIIIADVGDHNFDSTVLLDSFVWNATPGTPGSNKLGPLDPPAGSNTSGRLTPLGARGGPPGADRKKPPGAGGGGLRWAGFKERLGGASGLCYPRLSSFVSAHLLLPTPVASPVPTGDVHVRLAAGRELEGVRVSGSAPADGRRLAGQRLPGQGRWRAREGRAGLGALRRRTQPQTFQVSDDIYRSRSGDPPPCGKAASLQGHHRASDPQKPLVARGQEPRRDDGAAAGFAAQKKPQG